MRNMGAAVHKLMAASVAAALVLEPTVATAASGPVPLAAAGTASAVPLALYKKKKKKKKKKSSSRSKKKGPDLTPESAESKRAAIRGAAQGDVDAGEYAAAAQTMEENAGLLGDPVSYLEGADLRLRAAEKDRDIAQAQAAIEAATIAGDIGGFYGDVASGAQHSDWLVIDPASAGDITQRADDTVERAEALIEEIEAEQAASGAAPAAAGGGKAKDKKARKPRDKKPGLALLAAGGAATAVGAGGLSMALAGLIISSQKQKEVDQIALPDPEGQMEVDRLDEEGNRANLVGYIGIGVAAVGFGVGIPLIIVGAKRRKEAKTAPSSARVQVLPQLSRDRAGLAISGRF